MSSEEKNVAEDDPVKLEIKIIQDRRRDAAYDRGENFANECHDLVKEIFKSHGSKDVARNARGWTPLMMTIRSGNIADVKFLLANGCRSVVSLSTPGALSAIGLAAWVGLAMFEVVYNACPSALEDAHKHDYMSPLCIAVIKRDKELFFRLLELGLKVSEADEYTHLMMRKSRIPEIAELAAIRSDFEDTWDESMEHLDFPADEFERPQMSSTLDNIESSLSGDSSNESKNSSQNSEVPSIRIIPPGDKAAGVCARRNSQHTRLVNSLPRIDELTSYISPRLSCNRRQNFPNSPSSRLARRKEKDDDGFSIQDRIDNDKRKTHKYKLNRPPDLEIFEDNATGPEYFTEELHDNDPSILRGSKTPIEPPYATPPPGMILNADQMKIAVLLKRFGLAYMIPIFLEQEVDLDLFLTLSDQDLQEIGIKRKSDRNLVLSVIAECNGYKM